MSHRPKHIHNTVESSIGGNLADFEYGDDFSYTVPKAQFMKQRIDEKKELIRS